MALASYSLLCFLMSLRLFKNLSIFLKLSCFVLIFVPIKEMLWDRAPPRRLPAISPACHRKHCPSLPSPQSFVFFFPHFDSLLYLPSTPFMPQVFKMGRKKAVIICGDASWLRLHEVCLLGHHGLALSISTSCVRVSYRSLQELY